MEYHKWKNEIVKKYQNDNEIQMKQFGIKKIEDCTELEKELIDNNIFGTNDKKILKTLFNDKINEIPIVIGYGGNSNLHLGHLILINEILFYLRKSNNLKIYFVNLEVNIDKKFTEKIINYISHYFQNVNYEIIDSNNIEALKLKKKISKLLNINTVNRIMGWNNEKIYSYEKTLDMLTTFSLGKILNKKNPPIIITDLNQKTYYALYKTIEKKLSIQTPCFVYHMLMPSLKSPSERMSINNFQSLIYLKDSEEEIIKKIKSGYTGLDNKEFTCSLLRVGDLVLSRSEMEQIINDCVCIPKNCKYCKENNIK